jgi:hypothetical protein
MKQLSNRLDPVDDATLKRLREAATTYLSRLNPPGELEQWLVTPLPLETFGEITPLEAVRYDRLRASLFDYIAANTPSPQAAPGVPAQAGENPQPQNDQPRLVAVGGTAYRE